MNEKRVLIVLDVQNDFCPGGALPARNGHLVAKAIADLVASDHGYFQVLATQDWHISPGNHFSEHPDFADTWPPHCLADSFGAEFAPELKKAFEKFPPNAVFKKGEYRAVYSGFEGEFNGSRLGDYLVEREIHDLDIVGIATDFVVRETALEARRRGFNVRVFTNMIAPITEEYADLALLEMMDCGIEIVQPERV